MSEPTNHAEMLNAADVDGWVRTTGLRFTLATVDEVRAELTIGPPHHQPYGIVHGGVHAGIIETTCSVGAALNAMAEGRHAVGLENHTSFLRAVRSGKLTVVAKPIVRGRRSHVWEANVIDESERLVASGRVRMMILDADADLAGERVALGGSR
jgi:uncharacterized protein (TIGR00369 family)